MPEFPENPPGTGVSSFAETLLLTQINYSELSATNNRVFSYSLPKSMLRISSHLNQSMFSSNFASGLRARLKN